MKARHTKRIAVWLMGPSRNALICIQTRVSFANHSPSFWFITAMAMEFSEKREEKRLTKQFIPISLFPNSSFETLTLFKPWESLLQCFSRNVDCFQQKFLTRLEIRKLFDSIYYQRDFLKAYTINSTWGSVQPKCGLIRRNSNQHSSNQHSKH